MYGYKFLEAFPHILFKRIMVWYR